MNNLNSIINKKEKLAIGLMSGTSADGIDAVLVKITDSGIKTKVETVAFISNEYDKVFQKHILKVAKGDFGGTSEICKLSFCLGKMFADACVEVCKKANVSLEEIDFVGSHGHTVFHQPVSEDYFGAQIKSTLQIGEPSLINEKLNCLVVSDFRVRDVAAGGLGAPLVPYTEFVLYASETRDIALQNIGGIGNITYIPKNSRLCDVSAFDTGPGNMVMDAVYTIITKGEHTYDKNGDFAAKGKTSEELLSYLLNDDYYTVKLPKTTGREKYGQEYVDNLLNYAKKINLSDEDIMASVTMLTAKTIQIALGKIYKKMPDELIVGGGGVYNKTLMRMISDCLPDCSVKTQEDIGLDSGAKEAIAFAILANETIHGICNNAPGATGAEHQVVMGKISF